MKLDIDELQIREHLSQVAFTPKGGCPLKSRTALQYLPHRRTVVAFTPKGGCPLKWGNGVDSHPPLTVV